MKLFYAFGINLSRTVLMPKKETVIIESSNTYFGGGFSLLKQLVDELESRQQLTIVFLGYADVLQTLKRQNYQFIKLIPTNTPETLLRYLRKRERVLFFCNLPPFRKQRQSILYFHNQSILTPFSINNQKFSLKRESKNRIYMVW